MNLVLFASDLLRSTTSVSFALEDEIGLHQPAVLRRLVFGRLRLALPEVGVASKANGKF
ncbi:hypothetical protein DY000_02058383 [Brassica cretica]|uniref:Uncharacterized protein n=1 Tax=Brassica cretica TaxID=69181 RepID=A0ABQ7AFI8_BRACR|nr:hypothetical protein DY000_02058383 [Brassica cretica]